MRSGITKFEEETKEKVFHKPHSSNLTILHDGSTLNLHQASGMVEVDCDGGKDTRGDSDGEPEDPVIFNTCVVVAWLNITEGKENVSCPVREARRESSKGWYSHSFVEPSRAFNVDILVGVVRSELTVGDSSISNKFINLVFFIQGEVGLSFIREKLRSSQVGWRSITVLH